MRPARRSAPWLTVVLDDHTRAVAGYTIFAGAPAALNLPCALRQAIWRKSDPAWSVCGVPDVLHVDHGTDFTSTHLGLAAAALRTRIVHSALGRPQGRGKVERLFGTPNTELLSTLPGRHAGVLPRMPDSLEDLDLLRVMVARPRVIRRAGICFQGPR